MANITIGGLTGKTAVATDEIEVQATGGGASNKVTLASAFAANNGATLAANTFTALQTITQASANAGILASTGYSLTGSDATSMVNLAGTWNTSGTPTAIKLNITNTASNAASKLLDLQVGGTSSVAFKKPTYNDGVNIYPTSPQIELTNGVDTLAITAGGSYNSIIAATYGLALVATSAVTVDGHAAAAGVPTSGAPNGLNFSRRSIVFGRHAASTDVSFTQGTASIGVDTHTDDKNAMTLAVFGQGAYASAATNITGGGVTITGGAGASSSAGNAHGGNVTLTGGTGYGTGHAGYILMTNLPTSSAGLPSGAIWANSNVLTVVP